MRLFIGGYQQGKKEYVQKNYPDAEIFDGLHLWIREKMQKGCDVEQELKRYISNHPAVCIICDEIGNGLVPMDAFEREYRERVGRILIGLAEEAESVERIFCGMGQKIK